MVVVGVAVGVAVAGVVAVGGVVAVAVGGVVVVAVAVVVAVVVVVGGVVGGVVAVGGEELQMSDPGTVVIIVTIALCVYSYAMAKLAITQRAAFLEKKSESEVVDGGPGNHLDPTYSRPLPPSSMSYPS